MSTSRAPKRQREDDPVEPSKRQRQSNPWSQAHQQQQHPGGYSYMARIERSAMNPLPYTHDQAPQVQNASYRAPQLGASSLHPGLGMQTGNYGQAIQAQAQKLFTSQAQWLEAAKDDLERLPITIVPGIDRALWFIGDKMVSDTDLVPSHVWRLRSLGPSQRYTAYRYMILLTRSMIKHDQRSNEYQNIWTGLSSFRIRLVKNEQEWMDGIRKGTAEEVVERLRMIGSHQVADTMVTQAMVNEFDKYQKACLTALFKTDQGAGTTQPQVPTATPGPFEQMKTEQSGYAAPQALLQPHLRSAATQPAGQDASVKPDKIKFPNDQVPVPEYPPEELSYYTPNKHTGMYKCRHKFESRHPCCQTGLTAARMRVSIRKEIATWRSRVERLIKDGQLDPRHKTWDKTYNVAIASERAAVATISAGKKARQEAEQRLEKARQERHKEKRMKQAVQRQEEEEKRRQGEKLQKEIDEAIAGGRQPPAPLTKQSKAKDKDSSPDPKAAALKKHMREWQNCQALESRKKWPNWERFNAWWAVKRLQDEGAALSAEQRAVLEHPEPSGLSDKDLNLMKKKAEEEKKKREAEQEKIVPSVVAAGDDGLGDLFGDAEEL